MTYTYYKPGDRIRVKVAGANSAPVQAGDEFEVEYVEDDGVSTTAGWAFEFENIELASTGPHLSVELEPLDGVWVVWRAGSEEWELPDTVEKVFMTKPAAIAEVNEFDRKATFVRFGEDPYETL